MELHSHVTCNIAKENKKCLEVLTEAAKALIVVIIDNLLAVNVRSDDVNEKIIGLSEIITKMAKLEEKDDKEENSKEE